MHTISQNSEIFEPQSCWNGDCCWSQCGFDLSVSPQDRCGVLYQKMRSWIIINQIIHTVWIHNALKWGLVSWLQDWIFGSYWPMTSARACLKALSARCATSVVSAKWATLSKKCGMIAVRWKGYIAMLPKRLGGSRARRQRPPSGKQTRSDLGTI